MCTILIYRKPNSEWPLIIAQNRDENPERESLPLGRHWNEMQGIIGGMDLGGKAKGSWLASNENGVFASIVNLTGTVGGKAEKSRGKLVLDSLKFSSVKEAEEYLLKNIDASEYQPFFLVIADKDNAVVLKSDGQTIFSEEIPEGLSMITPRGLNNGLCPRYSRHKDSLIAAQIPEPGNDNWEDWIKLLSMPQLVIPTDGMTLVNREKNVETVSSSLFALNRTGKKVFKYAPGKPGEVQYQNIDTRISPITYEDFQFVLREIKDRENAESGFRESFRQSAVLIPLVEVDGKYYVVMTERSQKISKSGLIVFPGGKNSWRRDRNDSIETALREAKEECGIDPAKVKLIKPVKIPGNLQTYITADGGEITPVIGLIDKEELSKITTSDEVSKLVLFDVEQIIQSVQGRDDAIYKNDLRKSLAVIPGLADKPQAKYVVSHSKFVLPDKFDSVITGMVGEDKKYELLTVTAAILKDNIGAFQNLSALKDHLSLEYIRPRTTSDAYSESISPRIFPKFLSEKVGIRRSKKPVVLTKIPSQQDIDKEVRKKFGKRFDLVGNYLGEHIVNDEEAARIISYAVEVGDAIRNKLFEMQKWDALYYLENCHLPAKRALEKIDSEAEYFNFASVFRARAEDPRTKDQVALVFANAEKKSAAEEFTYSEIERKANQIRRVLISHGLDENSTIATMTYSPENLFMLAGALGIGSKVAPLFTSYKEEELLPRLNLTEADAILISPDQLDKVLALRGKLERSLKIFVVERDDLGNKLSFKEKEKLYERLASIDDAYPFIASMEKSPDTNVPLRRTKASDEAIIMMTSGSSGKLKEVLIQHSYALASYVISSSLWSINGHITKPENNTALKKDGHPVDNVYCTAPLGWMYGLRAFTVSVLAGARYHGFKTLKDKRNIPAMQQFMEGCKVSIFCGIPSILREWINIAEKEGSSLPDLARVISTGEPILASTREQVETSIHKWSGRNIALANSYALTEAGHTVSIADTRLPIFPKDAVGVILPGVELYSRELIAEPMELFDQHFRASVNENQIVVRTNSESLLLVKLKDSIYIKGSVKDKKGNSEEVDIVYSDYDETLDVGSFSITPTKAGISIQVGEAKVELKEGSIEPEADTKIHKLEKRFVDQKLGNNINDIQKVEAAAKEHFLVGINKEILTAIDMNIGFNGATGEYRFAPDIKGDIPDDDSLIVDFSKGMRFRKVNDSFEYYPGFPLVIHRLTRTDNLIKRYAIQIYPVEIERPISEAFPDRQLNITVGIKNDDKNAVVASFVEIPDVSSKKNLLAKYDECMAPISGTKRPDFVFFTSLPAEKREVQKIPVITIKETLEPLVNHLINEKGIKGGVFVINGLSQLIEKTKDSELHEMLESGQIEALRIVEEKQVMTETNNKTTTRAKTARE